MIKKMFAAAFLSLALAGVLITVAGGPAVTQQNRRTITVDTSIVSGGVFQTVLPAQNRFSMTIQNNNSISTGTEYCWIHLGTGTATTANSAILGPGGSFQRYPPSYVPSDPVQATCTSGGDTLYIDYQ